MFSRLIKSSPVILSRSVFVPKRYFGYGQYSEDSKMSFAQQIREEAQNQGVNPFYNPTAAGMKSELNGMQETIRERQANFKKKNNRKPTLEEMGQDPTVGPLFESIDRQKKNITATLQRWRFN